MPKNKFPLLLTVAGLLLLSAIAFLLINSNGINNINSGSNYRTDISDGETQLTLSVTSDNDDLSLEPGTIDSEVVKVYLQKMGLYPLNANRFIGEPTEGSWQRINRKPRNINSIEIVIKDIEDYEKDTNNDSNLSVRNIYVQQSSTGQPIIRNITGIVSSETLQIPLYVNGKELFVGRSVSPDVILSKEILYSIFLNFQTIPVDQDGDPYDRFTAAIEEVDQPIIQVRTGLVQQINHLVRSIKLVNIANAQFVGCSGSVQCGTLTRPLGTCTGSGTQCRDNSECPAGQTCNRPAAFCDYSNAVTRQCQNPPYGIECHSPCAQCTRGSCSTVAPPPPPPPPPDDPDDPPPPPGNTCSGDCFTGIANCGAVGRPNGSGTCSNGGLCCNSPGGGGGGFSAGCDLDWVDGLPRTVTIGVGETVQLRNYFDKGQGQLHDQAIRVNGPSGTVSVRRGDTPDPNDSSNKTINLNITGLNEGTVVIKIEGYAQYRSNCSEPHIDPDDCRRRNVCDSSERTIIVERRPWIQINDGALITDGRVNNPVPSGDFLIGSTISDAGIVTYRPTLNIASGAVSQPGWNANNPGVVPRMSYSEFWEKIPSSAEVISISGSFNQTTLSLGIPDPEGYEWYSASGNTVFTGNINIPSGRKIVVFVDGTVQFNGTINMADSKNSFFMVVTNNNITVSPPIGVPADNTTPQFEGIFVTDGSFVTTSGGNPNSRRINVRGSVIALGGVALARDTDSVHPSETFNFAPEFILNFPSSLAVKRAFWKEVAP